MKIQDSPFLSSEGNDYITKFFSWVVPSEKHVHEMCQLPNSNVAPHIGPTTISFHLDTIVNFDIRCDDVFVCALMKSGSSWMQNIVWLLTHNLDYERNQSIDRKNLMCNFDDFTKLRAAADEQGDDFSLKDLWTDSFGNMKSTRVFKTHCPIEFLPKAIWSKGARIIYVYRNPKDLVVSEYYYVRNAFHIDITVDDVVNGVINDAWTFSPRFNHILNFWNIEHLSNVFFVAYEDLVNNPFNTIKRISEFLDCHYSDEQLMKLTEYSSFVNMKQISTVNRESDLFWVEKQLGKKRPDAEFRFLRKGKAGAYRDDLNENQIQKIDNWTGKCLANSNFTFKL